MLFSRQCETREVGHVSSCLLLFLVRWEILTTFDGWRILLCQKTCAKHTAEDGRVGRQTQSNEYQSNVVILRGMQRLTVQTCYSGNRIFFLSWIFPGLVAVSGPSRCSLRVNHNLFAPLMTASSWYIWSMELILQSIAVSYFTADEEEVPSDCLFEILQPTAPSITGLSDPLFVPA